jgi:fimbrial chaperone protein
MSFRVAARFGAALCLAAAFGGVASAQAIAIAPVTVSLRPGELTTTITVINRGASETAVQIRPFLWQQPGGDDALEPTRDLLVSPPVARIEPGHAQTIRILLRKPATSKEDSYRLLLDQIPAKLPANGVRVALRISMPVFAAPPHPVSRQLAWQMTATAGGEADLAVTNSGTRHAHLSDVRVTLPDGREVRPEGSASFYVLPGSVRYLRLKGASLGAGTSVRLSAHSDEGEVVAPVLVTSRP